VETAGGVGWSVFSVKHITQVDIDTPSADLFFDYSLIGFYCVFLQGEKETGDLLF
jgi:hypothetical protein